MKNILDLDVKGKRVLVRADLNSPMENGRITVNPRIIAHAKTIRELSDRGARVIVISHQGRKGEHDFTSLEEHSKILKELAGRHVEFLDHVIGEKVKESIDKLKDGGILVLDNVRHLDDEARGDGKIVHALSPLVDLFVLDALSIAHREHASVVGFTRTVPSCAGDVLAEEVIALEKVRHSKEATFIFGGSKVEDSIAVMKIWLRQGRVHKILLGGALSILFIHAKGFDIGRSYDYLAKSGVINFLHDAKEMLSAYPDKIGLPADVGLRTPHGRRDVRIDAVPSEGEIFDIGAETVSLYEKIINQSGVIVANGPMGVYEIPEYAKGTVAILEAISKSKAFSLLGGGHTITALERSGLKKSHFGYVSLSGKALIEFLCGKTLPGLAALDENEKRFFAAKQSQ